MTPGAPDREAAGDRAAPGSAENPLIVVLDIGTTGARAAVCDAAGVPCAVVHEEYRSRFPAPGVVDHDPRTWLDAVARVAPRALSAAACAPAAVAAVAVASQRSTILPVDRGGRPLAPAILWQDKRTLAQCRQLAERVGEEELYEVTGLRIDPYFSLPKLMWFRQERAEIYRSAYRFLTVHDYIVHFLTGIFATEWTQASRTQLFDIGRFCWDASLARRCGLESVPFPEARPPGTAAGALTKEAADALGLLAGTPVVMAGGDQQCAAIGLGALRPGTAAVTTGTGSFVVAPVQRSLRDRERRILCSAAGVAGEWVLEAGIFTTGAALRWLRDEIARSEALEARRDGADPYDRICAAAAEAEAGAGGLLLLPHFAGSAAPYWDADARGVLFNLTLGHTRAQVFRAFLEGIAFEIHKNLRIMEAVLEESAGVPPDSLAVRAGGGAARSALFNQIQADVYGRAVAVAPVEEATVLGAALLAAVASGLQPDLASARAALDARWPPQTFEPDGSRRDLYRTLEDVHDRLYRALADAGVLRAAAAWSETHSPPAPGGALLHEPSGS